MHKNQNQSKFLKKCGPKSTKSLPPSLKLTPTIDPPPVAPQFAPNCHVPKSQLPDFLITGTVRNQLICIYHPGLRLCGFVDQHAMHERVRYEYYARQLRGQSVGGWLHGNIEKGGRGQVVVLGTRRLDKLMYVGAAGGLKDLVVNKYGVSMIVNSRSEVYLQSYHQILGRQLPDSALVELCLEVLTLQVEGSQNLPASLDRLLAEHACKCAIKFNDTVTLQWCQQLLHNAALCDFPWRCVHGRTSVYFRGAAHTTRHYTLD